MISKKFCFNCLKYGHPAADCPSSTCWKCNRNHHTSLCINNQLQDNSSNRDQETKEKVMACFGGRNVCYPIVIVNISVIQCRALEETGVGSKYTSAALINCIGTSPDKQWCCYTQCQEILKLTISTSVMRRDPFKLNVDIHKVEKNMLLTVQNP